MTPAAPGLVKDAFDVKVGLLQAGRDGVETQLSRVSFRPALPKHQGVCAALNAQLTSQVRGLEIPRTPGQRCSERCTSTVGVLSLHPSVHVESDFSECVGEREVVSG